MIKLHIGKKHRKLVYGIGVCDSLSKENGKMFKCHTAWKDMLRRCYDDKELKRYPTYIGCSVHPEWFLFSKFKEFYLANYREGYHLDKDILIAGNKVYSKDTCRFVPVCINSLFTDHRSARGIYPIGVTYNKTCPNGNPYKATLTINGKTKHLGRFTSPEEAHEAYLKAKKEYCIYVANREYDEGRIGLDIKNAVISRANSLIQ